MVGTLPTLPSSRLARRSIIAIGDEPALDGETTPARVGCDKFVCAVSYCNVATGTLDQNVGPGGKHRQNKTHCKDHHAKPAGSAPNKANMENSGREHHSAYRRLPGNEITRARKAGGPIRNGHQAPETQVHDGKR